MKNTKIVALVAAVALLVLGAAFTSMAATVYNWYQDGGEWRCADKNGDDIYDAWAKSGDGWYWLGEDGYMTRDALVDDGMKYVDAEGKMVSNKWVKIVDDENNEHWMYFQAGGKKLYSKTGEPKPVTVGDKKYIFDENGYMMSGWVEKDNFGQGDYEEKPWITGVYYCGGEDDGAVTYGWKQIECYNDEEDYLDNYYWFFFGTNGKKYAADPLDGTKDADNPNYLVKGINGKSYAFDVNGVMQYSWQNVYSVATTTIGDYAWFQSAEIGAKFANGWFRVVPTGNVDKANADDETSKWFYAKGGKLYNEAIKTINGKKYGFAANGEMVVGLCAAEANDTDGFVSWAPDGNGGELIGIDDATVMNNIIDSNLYDLYYFSADEDNDGSMKTGLQTVNVDGDDYSFFFTTSGVLKGTGATTKKGSKYYYNGIKVAADEDKADYMVFELDTTDDVLANREGKKFSEMTAGPHSRVAVISKTGVAASYGTKKDGNGWKATYNRADATWTFERIVE